MYSFRVGTGTTAKARSETAPHLSKHLFSRTPHQSPSSTAALLRVSRLPHVAHGKQFLKDIRQCWGWLVVESSASLAPDAQFHLGFEHSKCRGLPCLNRHYRTPLYAVQPFSSRHCLHKYYRKVHVISLLSSSVAGILPSLFSSCLLSVCTTGATRRRREMTTAVANTWWVEQSAYQYGLANSPLSNMGRLTANGCNRISLMACASKAPYDHWANRTYRPIDELPNVRHRNV